MATFDNYPELQHADVVLLDRQHLIVGEVRGRDVELIDRSGEGHDIWIHHSAFLPDTWFLLEDGVKGKPFILKRGKDDHHFYLKSLE